MSKIKNENKKKQHIHRKSNTLHTKASEKLNSFI